jgi:ethanolamine permease
MLFRGCIWLEPGSAAGWDAGLAIATVGAIILYITFTFSYAELACAIPKAGGVFDYATRGLNRDWGFIAGAAQLIEFLFAPPAIAAAIGAYFHLFLPGVGCEGDRVVAYILFTALNMYGVRAAAGFRAGGDGGGGLRTAVVLRRHVPAFFVEEHRAQFISSWVDVGVWAAVPFAIWFFLGLEGLANVAEEAVKPQRNIPLGFGSALVTLILLCVLVVFFPRWVLQAGRLSYILHPGADMSDRPLPLALSKITGTRGLDLSLC